MNDFPREYQLGDFVCRVDLVPLPAVQCSCGAHTFVPDRKGFRAAIKDGWGMRYANVILCSRCNRPVETDSVTHKKGMIYRYGKSGMDQVNP